MIITISEAEKFLRIEPGADDTTLQLLIGAAEKYLVNATGNQFDSTNELAKLFCLMLVTDWYENREMVGRVNDKIRQTVESMLAQLSHCYEPPPEVTA